MEHAELSKALWDIANGVVGFAIVQVLVFAYACANKDVGDILNRKLIKRMVAVMLLLIGLLQTVTVEWCRFHLGRLDPPNSGLYFEAGIGRVVIIGLITFFAVLILYARQLLAGKPFDG